MSKITLSTIAEAIDAKYGALEVEIGDGNSVSLLNALRLSDAKRTELAGLYEEKEGEEVDETSVTDRMVKTIRLAASTPEAADALIRACSPNGYPDLAFLSEIVRSYMEGQKTGEASASQD